MPEIEQIRPFGPDSQLYDIRDNTKLPLGYGTALPTNADLDDYTTPGKYYSATSSTTATILHKPDDVSIGFSLYVFGEDSDGLIQIVVETVASGFYGKIRYRMRTSASSNFQEWRKIYTSTETVPVGSHTHDAADVTSGALPIERGGTGAMTAAEALAALGAAASSHTHSQYYGSDVSRTKNTVLAAPNGSNGSAAFRALVAADLPTVPIDKGGTGATTVADARNALGLGNTSGALPIANGGTGATTVSLAVQNLQLLGLGAAETSIPSNADYNSYAEPGIYSVPNNTVAGTLAHRPTNRAGKLVVWSALARAGSPSATWYYVLQAYTDLYGTTWIRSGGTGSETSVTWNSWFRIYDTNYPPTASEVGAAAASHDHNSILSPFTYLDRATTADQDPGDRRLQFFSATAKMTTNKPPDGDGHILHFAWDNSSPSWASQLYIRLGHTAHMMIRGRDASSWGTWQRVYTEGDVVPIANGGTGKTTAAAALTALGGISKKLLWTNSAPTTAMSGKTIAISNMSSYQEFEVYFMLSTSTQYMESRHYIYNQQGRVVMHDGSSPYTRDVKPVSTGLTITTGTSSNYAIPYKVYGIKGVT